MNIGGRVVCDGCDYDLGNGNLFDCLVMSDVVDGVAETYHLCRDRVGPDDVWVRGCAREAKHPAALRAYLARNPDRDGWPAPTPGATPP